MKTFDLKISSVDKEFFSGKVINLDIPAEDGRLGVLADHAPLGTILAPGEIRFTLEDGKEQKHDCVRGFFMVKDNLAEVLLG